MLVFRDHERARHGDEARYGDDDVDPFRPILAIVLVEDVLLIIAIIRSLLLSD